jgi:hypothetical protein
MARMPDRQNDFVLLRAAGSAVQGGVHVGEQKCAELRNPVEKVIRYLSRYERGVISAAAGDGGIVQEGTADLTLQLVPKLHHQAADVKVEVGIISVFWSSK